MGDSTLSVTSDSDSSPHPPATPIAPSSASQFTALISGANFSLLAQTDSPDVEKQSADPLNITSSINPTNKELINVHDTSSSCSRDEVTIEDVTHAPLDWTSDNRCPYYPVRSDGCTEPRSCRDCLNVDIGNEYSCMVNQYGRCVQKDRFTYVRSLDFEWQEPSNDGNARMDQKVQFPAYKVDYCMYDDMQCKKCRDEVFNDVMEGRIDGSLTKFCYGKGGCVCIAVCEAPIWRETIGQTVCNGTIVNRNHESHYVYAYDGSQEKDGKGIGLSNLLIGVIGGLASVIILVAVVSYIRHRRNENGTEASSDMADSQLQDEDEDAAAAGSAPIVSEASTLSLFGWQAMRSELIEREHLLLAGVEDFSNVKTGYLQLLDVNASAPPQEEDESSAPVLLVPLAGASAPAISPRDAAAFASTPSAPPASPSVPSPPRPSSSHFDDDIL